MRCSPVLGAYAEQPTVTSRLLLLCLLGLLPACERSARNTVAGVTVDTLPSGVVVVGNPFHGQWSSSAAWTLVEDLRLGAVDGDSAEVFGRVMALEVDEEDNIYVLDSESREVRVFRPDGALSIRFGRAGAGPGEFRQVSGMTLGPDGNLWVLDFGNRRWSVFDRTGDHIAQYARGSNSNWEPWPGRFDLDGRLIDPISRDRVVRVDHGTNRADTFEVTLERPELFEVATPTVRTTRSVPFSPAPIWKLDRAGGYWYGTGRSYQLVRMEFGGDTVLIVDRSYDHQPVSEAERQREVQQLTEWASGHGVQPDLARIPATKPAFSDFLVADDGHLWVVSEAQTGEFFDTYDRFDVFDPEGRYLGEVRSDTPIFPHVSPVIRGNQMIAVTVDDLHVMYVVRLRIERS